MATMTIETAAESKVWPAEATCVCGQPLECSHTAHCPRCGITLRG